MRTLSLILALFCATQVCAGAWMRDEGTKFLSFSSVLDQSGQHMSSIYAEYGLRPKLTLGLKTEVFTTNGTLLKGNAYVFARKPIPTGERDFKLAYELGLGTAITTETKGLVRAGLNYGRGITLAGKTGWFNVDSAVEWVEGASTTVKLDGTLGLNLSDRFQVMFQVFYTHAEREKSTTLAPSLIWRPKPEARNSYLLGLEADDGVLAIKLGLWRSF